MLPSVKIAILGDTGTGKTSFLRRFKTNEFDELSLDDWRNANVQEIVARNRVTNSVGACLTRTSRTNPKHFPNLPTDYWHKRKCPSTLCTVYMARGKTKDSLPQSEMVDIRFLDAPSFPRFPQNSLQEWDEEGAVGIRSADVFIILYDVTKRETFRYAKTMKEGILSSICPNSSNNRRSALSRVLKSSTRNSSLRWASSSERSQRTGSGSISRRIRECFDRLGSRDSDVRRVSVQSGLVGVIPSIFLHSVVPMVEDQDEFASTHKRKNPPIIMIVANKCDLLPSSCGKCASMDLCRLRANNQVDPVNHEVAQLVRKTWKCLFVECSVKSGWNVMNLIKESLESWLEAREQTHRKSLRKSRQSK